MRMTGGPSSLLGLPRLLSSKSRDESMLTFHLTLIFREDDGRIDPWWWELVSRGHEADKAGEAVQAGNGIDIRVLAGKHYIVVTGTLQYTVG